MSYPWSLSFLKIFLDTPLGCRSPRLGIEPKPEQWTSHSSDNIGYLTGWAMREFFLGIFYLNSHNPKECENPLIHPQFTDGDVEKMSLVFYPTLPRLGVRASEWACSLGPCCGRPNTLGTGAGGGPGSAPSQSYSFLWEIPLVFKSDSMGVCGELSGATCSGRGKSGGQGSAPCFSCSHLFRTY